MATNLSSLEERQKSNKWGKIFNSSKCAEALTPQDPLHCVHEKIQPPSPCSKQRTEIWWGEKQTQVYLISFSFIPTCAVWPPAQG